MGEDKVYKKLLDIEKILKSLVRKEVRELKILGKEDKRIKRILRTTGFIFNDPLDWKIMIAEVCPNRRKIVGEKEAVFKCRLTKDYCDYDVCPKNKI